LLTASVSSQLVDDFQCPDEFQGFYPHLISCDKYWHCKDGVAELKLCGNGLGFMDTDDTFTLEQCAELHLVECGERTEIEPPISTRNCPRLYGTFPDEEDCGVFYKCQDGKSNRYNCPPGLAYDSQSRGCRWADQVKECSSPVVTVDEEGGEFQCPSGGSAGTFTKHPHPADCRQYFLCISGVPREYGCPLGTVFNVGSGTGIDGKCSDPEEVPECRDYYGDLEFKSGDLSKNGFDSGRLNRNGERVRSGSVERIRNSNSIPRAPTKDSSSSFREPQREKSRPAPPSLQAIVDTGSSAGQDRVRSRPSRPQAPTRFQPQRPSRPEAVAPPPRRPDPVVVLDEEPEEAFVQPTLPPRLQPIRIEPAASPTTPEPIQTTEARTQPPRRLQVLTDRPDIQTTLSQTQSTGGSRFGSANRPGFSSVFNNVGGTRFQPTEQPTTSTRSTTQPPPPPPAAPAAPSSSVVSEATEEGLPPPVKAAPGPNGEEYYYYYYYYDDEEGEPASSS